MHNTPVDLRIATNGQGEINVHNLSHARSLRSLKAQRTPRKPLKSPPTIYSSG
jgi:hypothetical protein